MVCVEVGARGRRGWDDEHGMRRLGGGMESQEDNINLGGVERVNLRWPLRCDE
jgi:hypothetical protein